MFRFKKTFRLWAKHIQHFHLMSYNIFNSGCIWPVSSNLSEPMLPNVFQLATSTDNFWCGPLWDITVKTQQKSWEAGKDLLSLEAEYIIQISDFWLPFPDLINRNFA